jgi:hypothetical protein
MIYNASHPSTDPKADSDQVSTWSDKRVCRLCAGGKVGALEITAENKHLLRSGYTRRRPEELAVLTR